MKTTTTITAQTRDWILTTLTNDEASTDQELVEHFMTEGQLTEADARYWVGRRNEFLGVL